MTCIVGLVDDDGMVYMGGDSAATLGNDLRLMAGGKVSRVGEFLIGITGSVRTAQIMRHALRPPPITDDLDAYMATAFVDALRECFKAAGFARREQEQERAGAATLLVGVRGRLYLVCTDYGIVRAQEPFAAIGCGDMPALGALYATAGRHPGERVGLALAAAEHFNIGVRRPFTLDATPDAQLPPAGWLGAPSL
jgi:ATP-dependent protease HslVU (ClpYQ) peptidase subunit